MNIFFLDLCPQAAARAQVPKSASKMIVESAQLLSTCVRVYLRAAAPPQLYRITHLNHPCAKWLRRSAQHWDWLIEHARHLAQLHRERFGKEHKSAAIVELAEQVKPSLPERGFTLTARDLAIQSTLTGQRAYAAFLRSDQQLADAVLAYRAFYAAKSYVKNYHKKHHAIISVNSMRRWAA